MKDLDLVKIFDSMKENNISEVVIKDGKALYEVRRGGFKQNVAAQAAPVAQTVPLTMPQNNNMSAVGSPLVQQHQTPAAVQELESSAAAETAKAGSSNLYELKSPLVGTFYGAPKPEDPPFVEVGDKVKKGQTLCIVEAMKNFNEIESEVDGVIREICVKNNDLVEFGKVLFKIELQ
jgi:acetyl-CoA carboxylase biotin carboxyl carrier protein